MIQTSMKCTSCCLELRRRLCLNWHSMIVNEEGLDSMGPLIQGFRRFLYNGGRVPTEDQYSEAFMAAGFADVRRIGTNLLSAKCED